MNDSSGCRSILVRRYQDLHHRLLSIEQVATADLVVFFFLRSYTLVRSQGHLGLLARRSLAEGKNREVGLEPLIKHGVVVCSAHTNIPWPGKASVVVHQVHLVKGEWKGSIVLNGSVVEIITSYLDDIDLGSPMKLVENGNRMFQGTILGGEGFKILEEVATAWLDECADNSEILSPFIGGNDVNSDSQLRPACWVVNFWDWTEEQSAEHESPYRHLLEHVKPERQRRRANGEFVLRKVRAERWWHFAEKAQGLYHAVGRGHSFRSHPKGWDRKIVPLQRVLAISRGVTKYPAFTFLENKFVFSEKLYVLADDRYSIFGVLSSDLHAVWAWAQKTSLGADLFSLSYTHGNIYETFPFPDGLLTGEIESVSAAGKNFFEARAEYMSANNKGLTKVYNDFHNASLESDGIKALRSLQANLTEAVFHAYGLENIDTEFGFHEVGYLPSGNNLRFTVSENVRLALLRHLSKLNKLRAATAKSSEPVASGRTVESMTSQEDLFESGGDEA
jgi:hypothetical protein